MRAGPPRSTQPPADQFNPEAAIRICFVIPRAYNFLATRSGSDVGGAEKQTATLGVWLARTCGADVHFAVADFGQDEVETHQGVTTHKAFSFDNSRIAGAFSLYRTLKRIDAEVYVFRAADMGVLAGWAMVRRLGRKMVYMVASDHERCYATLRTMVGRGSALAMGLVYPRADAVTVQTARQFDLLRKERGIEADAVVPNIHACSVDRLRALNARRDSVLWVGRSEPLKRMETVLALADLYPGEQFVCICPRAKGRDDYWQGLRRAAAQRSNIDFREFVPPSRIMELYLHAKIYLQTSEYEGFSNTMMEAMEGACPILSLAVNPDEILDRHDMGLCAGDDPALFREQFAGLLADEPTRRRMGENGRAYLEAHHAPEGVAKDFQGLLETVVGK